MDNTRITVYTPVYNRAYVITRLYESLLRQSNKNFIWMVIDDGSTDNLKELLDKWRSEGEIEIIYFYQVNSGKQEAVNFAHMKITTELNLCVDSDDFLLDNAIDVIFKEWEKVRSDQTIAGLVGLDIDNKGTVIGTEFPKKLTRARFSDFKAVYKINGDKKFIYKTEIIRRYSYPNFKGEKFPAPGYIYRLVDQNYFLHLFNIPICVVEYLPDGLSKNKFLQLKNANNSFRFYRIERMRLAVNYLDKFKNASHYVSLCIIGNVSIFKNNPYKLSTFFAVPFGLFIFLFVKLSNRKGVVS